jgi:Protein of unknown function (DUF3175)
MARTVSKRRSGGHAKGSRKRASSRRAAKARGGRRWSRRVTEHSDALTLEHGVFTLRDPKRIAASLKRSAERSRRRKGSPFRSALSMLTFYIQPRRQEPAGDAQAGPDASEGRAAQAVREGPRLTSGHRSVERRAFRLKTGSHPGSSPGQAFCLEML